MTNTYNDGTFTYKKASNVLSSMTDYLLTNSSKLNDFTTGSALETILEAESLDIEELYYLTVENMTTAIDNGVLEAFNFSRKTATYAYGNVTITFTKTLTVAVTIPKGITFTSSNSSYTNSYETEDEYVVPAGSSSITIPVYCTTTGSSGNIPSGVLDTTSDLSGISSVINTNAFQTGTDEESLLDMQTRFRAMIQSLARGTVQSLKYATLAVDDITSVDIYEAIYGVAVVYCCDANGDLSTTLQTNVATYLEDWRPAGINILVRPVNKTISDITIALDMASSELETDDFITLVKTNIESYINSHHIGQSLYVNDLVQKVMDISDNGINDCSVDVEITPNYSISEDTLSDTTSVKIGAEDVTQNDLEPIDFNSTTNYGLVGSQNTTSTTSVDNETGNTWSDATTVTDDSGNVSYNPITVSTRYITQNNEIIKSNSITVYFIDTTNYIDYDNYSTGTTTDSLDNLLND